MPWTFWLCLASARLFAARSLARLVSLDRQDGSIPLVPPKLQASGCHCNCYRKRDVVEMHTRRTWADSDKRDAFPNFHNVATHLSSPRHVPVDDVNSGQWPGDEIVKGPVDGW
ncbi:hypothetical protein NW757_003694 [Fusarium falciforme]|nr:hypothetical protein NW757_003694 [Fusarium falciforme]